MKLVVHQSLKRVSNENVRNAGGLMMQSHKVEPRLCVVSGMVKNLAIEALFLFSTNQSKEVIIPQERGAIQFNSGSLPVYTVLYAGEYSNNEVEKHKINTFLTSNADRTQSITMHAAFAAQL